MPGCSGKSTATGNIGLRSTQVQALCELPHGRPAEVGVPHRQRQARERLGQTMSTRRPRWSDDAGRAPWPMSLLGPPAGRYRSFSANHVGLTSPVTGIRMLPIAAISRTRKRTSLLPPMVHVSGGWGTGRPYLERKLHCVCNRQASTAQD